MTFIKFINTQHILEKLKRTAWTKESNIILTFLRDFFAIFGNVKQKNIHTLKIYNP